MNCFVLEVTFSWRFGNRFWDPTASHIGFKMASRWRPNALWDTSCSRYCFCGRFRQQNSGYFKWFWTYVWSLATIISRFHLERIWIEVVYGFEMIFNVYRQTKNMDFLCRGIQKLRIHILYIICTDKARKNGFTTILTGLRDHFWVAKTLWMSKAFRRSENGGRSPFSGIKN